MWTTLKVIFSASSSSDSRFSSSCISVLNVNHAKILSFIVYVSVKRSWKSREWKCRDKVHTHTHREHTPRAVSQRSAEYDRYNNKLHYPSLTNFFLCYIYIIVFLDMCILQAKHLIALHWKKLEAQSIGSWLKEMSLEKITCMYYCLIIWLMCMYAYGHLCRCMYSVDQN